MPQIDLDEPGTLPVELEPTRKRWVTPVVIKSCTRSTQAHVTNFTDGSSGFPYGS